MPRLTLAMLLVLASLVGYAVRSLHPQPTHYNQGDTITASVPVEDEICLRYTNHKFTITFTNCD